MKNDPPASSYKRGVRDAIEECHRIGAPALVRWNLAQLLQAELSDPDDTYAEGYQHGRSDAIAEIKALLTTYGLFTGKDAAEAVGRVKR
jgi:TPP-dependent pyruvate/acetoin dehydrogenase alpha subunit